MKETKARDNHKRLLRMYFFVFFKSFLVNIQFGCSFTPMLWLSQHWEILRKMLNQKRQFFNQ